MSTLQDQLELEKHYKNNAREYFLKHVNDELEKGNGSNLPPALGMKNHFKGAFLASIQNWITQELTPRRGAKRLYFNLLSEIVRLNGDKETALQFAALTFDNCLSALTANELLTVSSVATNLSKAIYYENFIIARLRSVDASHAKELEKEVAARDASRYKFAFIKQSALNDGFTWIEDDGKARRDLAAQLLWIFCESTGLASIEPEKNQKTYLQPTEAFYKIWSHNLDHIAGKMCIHIPTIIPPKPWESVASGAYYGALAKYAEFMRIKPVILSTTTAGEYLRQLDEEAHLEPIYHAINKIQNTAYTINKDLLHVVGQLIALGGERGGLERLEPLEEIPELVGDFTEAELKAHKKAMHARYKKEIARRSKALRVYKTYNIAKEFSVYERIYFPCNTDFRGRIYPLSYLCHQGDDLMKSLLHYADPVPAQAEDDIAYLEVVGANLYGNDKISLADRRKWIQSQASHIVASAQDPLNNTFWEQADEPLQFLAFCIEYARALEYVASLGTFIGFVCRIPIAFDGTCSGTQHYTAMLRDRIGGSAVNLIDHDKPADIYQEVANRVISIAKIDAMSGSEDQVKVDEDTGHEVYYPGTKSLATTWLAYGITRKVCKRSVMTLAYGSEQYGFADHIEADITKEAKEFEGFQKKAARYMAKLIWNSLQDTAISAISGMDYLKKLAGELAKAGKPVTWITPIGLPIQQQYLITHDIAFKTKLGPRIRLPIYYYEVAPGEEISRHKQVQGIAPNFIHSLDSTHLMMTVNGSNLKNYTTIHDSFGTSLGEARDLCKAIREQFYKLYNEHDPLEEFRTHVEEVLGYPIDIERPEKGDLDIKEVLTSTYIFH